MTHEPAVDTASSPPARPAPGLRLLIGADVPSRRHDEIEVVLPAGPPRLQGGAAMIFLKILRDARARAEAVRPAG